MSFKNNIGNTLISKLFTAFFSLGSSVLLSRYLGRDAMGDIALVVMGVTISLIFSGVWAGPVLTYFASRKPLKGLLIPAYISGLLFSILVPPILSFFGLLKSDLVWMTILIGAFQNIHGAHLSYLLGIEKVRAHNQSALLQVIIVFAGFGSLIFSGNASLINYLYIVAFSFFVSAFISAFYLKSSVNSESRVLQVSLETARYSSSMQLSTLLHFFNYRISYYFIDSLLGTATLGLFSLAMQIMEGVLLLSRSIATVLFSRVSASENAQEKLHKTLLSFKLSILSTLLCIIVLFLIPSSVFTLLFGEEFSGLKNIFYHISAGILLLSGLNILSSFFSGDYKASVNLYTSFIGLISILIFSWPMTKYLGLAGAGWANAISFGSGLSLAIFILLKNYPIQFKDLFPTKNEWNQLKTVIHNFRKK